MKIFVTGASGFLGKHLCATLRAAGHEVTAPSSRDCDLLRDDALHAFTTPHYERIFHLAAWTQAGDFCLRHPGEQWVRNQKLNTNVLAWWSEHQPQAKLITIGTSCAYAPERPLREEHYLEGQPIESLFTYGMTKRMLFIGQQSLAKQFGLRHLTVVPSTLYGSEYHSDGRQLHFIFDLIRKIVLGHHRGDPVVLWGDGYQRRELIHVDDFVRTMLQLAEGVEGEIVNIGCGYEHTIREFADLISRSVGYDPALIQYDPSRYVGAKSKCLEIGKLKKLLPEFSPTSLEIGLPPVVAWVREHLVK
jgi:GDP-L-fucose synthase